MTLTAFVLMPFQYEFNKFYEEIIQRVFEEEGFVVSRADTTLDQRNIMRDVIEGIHNADLIIADLSIPNPNVFYELGIAHTLNKKTILLTQSIMDLPFDLRSYRVFEYSTDYYVIQDLIVNLKKIIENFKNDSLDFGNPVTDFLSISSVNMHDGVTGLCEYSKINDEQIENGLYDLILGGYESIEEMTKYLLNMADEANNYTQLLKLTTAKIYKMKENKETIHPRNMKKIVDDVASITIEYSISLEKNQKNYHNSLNKFEENFSHLFKNITVIKNLSVEELVKIQQGMQNIQIGNQKALEGLKIGKTGVTYIQGYSRELNIASRRLLRDYDEFNTDLLRTDAILEKLLNMLNEIISLKQK